MPSSVVLLSGGLDSTVNFYEALRNSNVLLALTFDYGQRASEREVQRASEICKRTKTPHELVPIQWFQSFTQTGLVNQGAEIPEGENVNIESTEKSEETAKAVWVPNRNGIFLNIAAGFAEGHGADWVIPGFNKEEAETFPDNSQNFINAINQSFLFSTNQRVQVMCYTTHMNKREIVMRGRELEIPFDLLWPCYFSGENLCKKCESCQRYFRAIEESV